jgi:hypothetical protein
MPIPSSNPPPAAACGAPVSLATNLPEEINASASPSPCSYLDASHCPPAPSPKTPPPPFKNLSLDGCFCCISIFHLVRSCRDPVRCRGCGHSSHRRRECTMPFPQLTFIPTTTSPHSPAALPTQPTTLQWPRHARSPSPPRRMGYLFEVGEPSNSRPELVPLPPVERVVPI